jgi:hypothetical protein
VRACVSTNDNQRSRQSAHEEAGVDETDKVAERVFKVAVKFRKPSESCLRNAPNFLA